MMVGGSKDVPSGPSSLAFRCVLSTVVGVINLFVIWLENIECVQESHLHD